MTGEQLAYVQGPKIGKIRSSSDEQKLINILEAVIERLGAEFPSSILNKITPEGVLETGSMSFRLEITSSPGATNINKISSRCEQLMNIYVALEQSVSELVDLTKRYASPSGSGFLSIAEQSCRKIGETVNAKAGFKGMEYVCTRVGIIAGRVASRDLECAWDGIGNWMG